MSRKSRSSTSYYREHPPQEKARVADDRRRPEGIVYLPPCSRCGKGRTPRTHINAIEPLDRIICRRTECERFKGLIKSMIKPGNLVIKVNHYHCGEPVLKAAPHEKITELPPGSSTMGRVELPGDLANYANSGTERPYRLRTILEEGPPKINVSTKPTSSVAEMIYAIKKKKRDTGLYHVT